jgi:hypothetical protein
VAQISLYLEDGTAQKLRSVAESHGVSVSSLVADLIRNKIAREWPECVIRLAGAWKDFPTLDEIRQGQPEDVPRESL